jgi:hypothetical protein
MTLQQLVLWIRDRKIKSLIFNFSGGGDSGSFDGWSAFDQNDNHIDDPFDINPESHDAKVEYILNALEDVNEDALFDATGNLTEQGGDWWNNEGGHGTLTILDTGKWELVVIHTESVGVGEENEDGIYEEYEYIDGETNTTIGKIDMEEVPNGTPPVPC